jgi:UDP-N-acetylglucosamine 2-epimerase
MNYDPNMSDIFFREVGMPEEINRKLTDAISDPVFVWGGRSRRRADRRRCPRRLVHTETLLNWGGER